MADPEICYIVIDENCGKTAFLYYGYLKEGNAEFHIENVMYLDGTTPTSRSELPKCSSCGKDLFMDWVRIEYEEYNVNKDEMEKKAFKLSNSLYNYGAYLDDILYKELMKISGIRDYLTKVQPKILGSEIDYVWMDEVNEFAEIYNKKIAEIKGNKHKKLISKDFYINKNIDWNKKIKR